MISRYTQFITVVLIIKNVSFAISVHLQGTRDQALEGEAGANERNEGAGFRRGG